MSEEIKNQQAAEPEALTETEINEQMQVRINKMHQIEEKASVHHLQVIPSY